MAKNASNLQINGELKLKVWNDLSNKLETAIQDKSIIQITINDSLDGDLSGIENSIKNISCSSAKTETTVFGNINLPAILLLFSSKKRIMHEKATLIFEIPANLLKKSKPEQYNYWVGKYARLLSELTQLDSVDFKEYLLIKQVLSGKEVFDLQLADKVLAPRKRKFKIEVDDEFRPEIAKTPSSNDEN